MFDDSLKIKDALQIYFAQNNFNDGGYNDRYFKIILWKISFPLPNIKARVDAVKIHDIHHIITEYTTTNKGEAEIGSWEIASGCGKLWVGWILNLGSFVIGLLCYQRALLNAFLAGRKVKTNLCYNTIYDDALLNKTVGELRNEIVIFSSRKNSVSDYLMFILWSLISIVYHLIIISAFLFAVYKLMSFLF